MSGNSNRQRAALREHHQPPLDFDHRRLGLGISSVSRAGAISCFRYAACSSRVTSVTVSSARVLSRPSSSHAMSGRLLEERRALALAGALFVILRDLLHADRDAMPPRSYIIAGKCPRHVGEVRIGLELRAGHVAASIASPAWPAFSPGAASSLCKKPGGRGSWSFLALLSRSWSCVTNSFASLR